MVIICTTSYNICKHCIRLRLRVLSYQLNSKPIVSLNGFTIVLCCPWGRNCTQALCPVCGRNCTQALCPACGRNCTFVQFKRAVFNRHVNYARVMVHICYALGNNNKCDVCPVYCGMGWPPFNPFIAQWLPSHFAHTVHLCAPKDMQNKNTFSHLNSVRCSGFEMASWCVVFRVLKVHCIV